MKQAELRQKTRQAKAMNTEFTFKDFAEAIDITEHSFYNWLNGSYDLSEKKAKYLSGLIDDLL